MSEQVTCQMCGSVCRIAGDDREGTHYYEPLAQARIAALESALGAIVNRRFVSSRFDHDYRPPRTLMRCLTCWGEWPVVEDEKHEDVCPIANARALLAASEPGQDGTDGQ